MSGKPPLFVAVAQVELHLPGARSLKDKRQDVRSLIERLRHRLAVLVVEGLILRTAKARLLRYNVVIWEGGLSSLKRFKDDAAEVRNGFECGIGLEKYQDIKLGDVIEAYRTVEVAREA